MGDSAPAVDTIILVLGIALIVFTAVGASRKRSGRKPTRGEATALIGIAVWLGCLGVALYMIFG
ncbi:MAG: hypothetical protein ACREKQ_08985 [Candidatus Rokuibacteriota bacterium]